MAMLSVDADEKTSSPRCKTFVKLDPEASYARWKRFVELDPVVGLREAGLTELEMKRILSFAKPLYVAPQENSVINVTLDMLAFLLAVLGRGSSLCQSFHLGNTKLVGLNEVMALCANLSSNPTIETLEVHSDGLVTRGVVRIADPTSQTLDLPMLMPVQELWTLLSNALRTNYTLTSLVLSRDSIDDDDVRILLFGAGESPSWQTVASELKEDLAVEVRKCPRKDETILRLKRDIAIEAEKRQIGGLQVNTTVEHLGLSGNLLSNEGVGHVAEFLRTNSSLKRLEMEGIQFDLQGVRLLADALKHNDTLETLMLGHEALGGDVTECLLEPFSQNVKGDSRTSSDGLDNTSVRRLELWYWGLPGLVPLARLIETNKTLTSLCFVLAELSKEDWIGQIFPALSKNETLQELELLSCPGLEGDEVGEALMDLIRNSNMGLRKIDLQSIDLLSWQARVNEELRIKRENRDKLRDQSTAVITSGQV